MTFRHRGLRQFYDHGNSRYIKPEQVERIRRILALLDAASGPRSLDLPGLRLHALKGDWKGFWAVNVTGNWRIVFQFKDGEPRDVDLIDYH